MKISHLILEVRFAHTFKRKNNETLIYQFTYVFISRIKMMCKLRDVTTVLTMRSDTPFSKISGTVFLHLLSNVDSID